MHNEDLNQTEHLLAQAQSELSMAARLYEGEREHADNDAQGCVSALRAIAADADSLGLRGLTEALVAIADAVDTTQESERLHPPTVTLIRDAITGSNLVVQSMGLGELQAVLSPDLLTALRDAAATPIQPAADADEENECATDDDAGVVNLEVACTELADQPSSTQQESTNDEDNEAVSELQTVIQEDASGEAERGGCVVDPLTASPPPVRFKQVPLADNVESTAEEDPVAGAADGTPEFEPEASSDTAGQEACEPVHVEDGTESPGEPSDLEADGSDQPSHDAQEQSPEADESLEACELDAESPVDTVEAVPSESEEEPVGLLPSDDVPEGLEEEQAEAFTGNACASETPARDQLTDVDCEKAQGASISETDADACDEDAIETSDDPAPAASDLDSMLAALTEQVEALNTGASADAREGTADDGDAQEAIADEADDAWAVDQESCSAFFAEHLEKHAQEQSELDSEFQASGEQPGGTADPADAQECESDAEIDFEVPEEAAVPQVDPPASQELSEAESEPSSEQSVDEADADSSTDERLESPESPEGQGLIASDHTAESMADGADANEEHTGFKSASNGIHHMNDAGTDPAVDEDAADPRGQLKSVSNGMQFQNAQTPALDPNQPLDPTGGVVALDPNQPLDPTGGAVALDPNQPLAPTGGAVALDPNQPLDPTGGAVALDPNQPLDPTGGAVALDPNQPLDPTGGAVALDPNQPLDPTGGAVALDPNQPLDPTGGAVALDPNQPLDPTGGAAGVDSTPFAEEDSDEEWGSTPIMLSPEQIERLQVMVTEVRRNADEIEPVLSEALEFTSRAEAAGRLVGLAGTMSGLGQEFNLSAYETLVEQLALVGSRMADLPDALIPEIAIRVRGLANLFDQLCAGLEVGFEVKWPMRTFKRRLGFLLEGKMLREELVDWHQNDVERLLELDGVAEGMDNPPQFEIEIDENGGTSTARRRRSSSSDASSPTIRVEREAIDDLLDILRQLVLNKNYFVSASDALKADSGGAAAEAERIAAKASEYDRLVARLQDRLTSTRVQPIGKIIERFERLVRDVANLGDRIVELRVEGGETVVDKFMLDAIAEPIGRMLRQFAGHCIGTPDEREAVGKPRHGYVSVAAENQGSHVAITISHDGQVPELEDLQARVVALAEGAPEAACDADFTTLFNMQYDEWFHDSELAGVRQDLEELGATLEAFVDTDGISRCRLLIPVKGAVIGVMRVRIGDSVYAIPIRNINEITGLSASSISTIDGHEVIQFRGSPVGLIDPRRVLRLGPTQENGVEPEIAVIFTSNGETAAIKADAVIGYYEIVIESLNLDDEQGPFLGGAIQNDGSVALVFDLEQLLLEARASATASDQLPDGTGGKAVA